MAKNFQVLSSKLVLDAPIIAVRQDRIATPTGEATREVVEHFSAVAIAAVRENEVLLLRQYRHPVGEYLWEIPAGLLDVAGEEPLVAAQRELAEEAGLTAGQWDLLGDVANTPGCSQERCRIYRASDLRAGADGAAHADTAGAVLEHEEADLELRWVPIPEAVRWVQEGRIINSVAVAAVFHLLAGTRRDADTEFRYTSGLAERRSRVVALGEDMKFVR